jgi:hypothetical protein
MSEKKTRRYNFTALVFGNDGDVNLVVETATSDFGYLTQYAMELTPAERQELITVLLTAKRVGEQN